jgi:hypothetical protein
MKILITGSTPSQCSLKTSKRVPTFAGLIAENLSSSKVQIEFSLPQLGWEDDYLKSFDAILVGVSPITSVAANSVYPALHTAYRAEKMGKLFLFIDAPEPHKIKASLASFEKGNVDLFKPFHQGRRDYDKVSEDPKIMRQIEVFCQRLQSSKWPTTLYPWMPWVPPEQVQRHLPNIPEGGVHGVSVDSYLMKKPYIEKSLVPRESDYWVYDNNKTKWSRRSQESLRFPAIPMKEGRFSSSQESSQRLSGALGSLVTPYRSDEMWWTPLPALSLNLGVPVVSDWRVTKTLGGSWNYLPAAVEDMTNAERFGLALSQRSSYMEMLDSKKDTNEMIILSLTK